jgi:hypothetical protein
MAGDEVQDEPPEGTSLSDFWLTYLGSAAASGELAPLTQRDRLHHKIQTPVGPIHWSNHAEINSLLADLRSSLRLVTIGNWAVWMEEVRRVLGRPLLSLDIDPTFILGGIGPCSTTPFGPLYDFVVEYAVSPTLDSSEAGFNFSNGIVTRRAMMNVREADFVEGSMCRWPPEWMSCFIHECIHARSFSFGRRHSHFRARWFAQVVNDILRICDSESDMSHVEHALVPNYANVLLESGYLTELDPEFEIFLGVNEREFLRGWPISRIIDGLVGKGLLHRSGDTLRSEG